LIKEEFYIRTDKYIPGDGRPRNVYIYKCSNCPNEIQVKALKRLKSATGLCVKCNNARMHPDALAARRLKPFEAMFNRIKDSAKSRDIKVKLTYEEFLEFTKEKDCHYCLNSIYWEEFGASTYNLDRKNNDSPYIKENLVVYCGRCNKGKREIYSYEEWFGMTEYFRNQKYEH
jgi:hypothetical protein